MSCGSTLAALLNPTSPKLYCEEHKGEEIRRYCKTCSAFVCLECILDGHKGHTILKISELAESKKGDIIELVNLVKCSHVVELKTRIQESKEAKRINRGCIIECIKWINRRTTSIKIQLDKIKQEMISDLKESQKYEVERLDDIEKYLIKETNGLTTLVKSIEKSISSNNGPEMIHLGFSLETAIQNLQHCPPSTVEALEFCTGEMSQSLLEDMFGFCRNKEILVEVQSETGTFTHMNVERRVDPVSSYKVADMAVSSIIPCKDGTAWINIAGKRHISLDSEGETLKREDLDSIIIDMGLSVEGDVIVVMKKRHRLIRVRKNGQKLDFIDTKPLYPNGVHVTSQGDVYVSVIDSETSDTPQDSKRCVIKYSSTGTGLQKFAKNDKGEHFFTTPRKLTVTTDNDVCIIDVTSLFTGRIVALTSSGDQRYVYNGRNDLGMGAFNPTSIKCNSHGSLVISDFDNSVLHLLNKEGQLIFLLNTNQTEGIYGPCALGIDRNDGILIGTFDGYILKMAALKKTEEQASNKIESKENEKDKTETSNDNKKPESVNKTTVINQQQKQTRTSDKTTDNSGKKEQATSKKETSDSVNQKHENVTSRQSTSQTKSSNVVTRQPSNVTKNDTTVTRQLTNMTKNDTSLTRQSTNVTKNGNMVTRQPSSVTKSDISVARQPTNMTKSDNMMPRQPNNLTKSDNATIKQSKTEHDIPNQSTSQVKGNQVVPSPSNDHEKGEMDLKNSTTNKDRIDQDMPDALTKINQVAPTSQPQNNKVSPTNKKSSDNIVTSPSTSQTKNQHASSPESNNKTNTDKSKAQNKSVNDSKSVQSTSTKPSTDPINSTADTSVGSNSPKEKGLKKDQITEDKTDKSVSNKTSQPTLNNTSKKDVSLAKPKSLELETKSSDTDSKTTNKVASKLPNTTVKTTGKTDQIENKAAKNVGQHGMTDAGLSSKTSPTNKGVKNNNIYEKANNESKEMESKGKDKPSNEQQNDTVKNNINTSENKQSTSKGTEKHDTIDKGADTSEKHKSQDTGRYKPDRPVGETLKNEQAK